jgi:diguanylate cyclase (GGDEF)-like protein
MSAVLVQLLQMVGLLVVLALALGLVFDHVERGLRRDVAVGLLSGTAAMSAMFLSYDFGAGFHTDARGPILMVGALFGGPVGALAALPLPLATRVVMGGPAVLVGVASILSALAVGLLVHAATRALSRPVDRLAVIALAALSPLTLVSLLAPHFAPEPGMLVPLVVPFLVFLPFGTAVLGLFTAAELARSDAARSRRETERFQRSTNHVSREFLDRQLAHYGHMHLRFGTHCGYMVVSVDEAAAIVRAIGERRWARLRTEIAQVLRSSVRDSDICAAVDFDRFGVLLPYTGEAGMQVVAERIQRNVIDSFGRSPAGAVTVSIGMASFTNGESAEDLVALAESALFVANARTPRNALGPLPKPRNAAVIHSFPAAVMDRVPDERPAMPPAPAVALFPALVEPDSDTAA